MHKKRIYYIVSANSPQAYYAKYFQLESKQKYAKNKNIKCL